MFLYLGDFAIVSFDRRHSEQVPKRTAIFTVVEQPHGATSAVLHSVSDDGHLLRVGAFSLQEPTATPRKPRASSQEQYA